MSGFAEHVCGLSGQGFNCPACEALTDRLEKAAWDANADQLLVKIRDARDAALSEVEGVKQQLPFGAWRDGASLARCVEDLRMERDLYRGTLVGLLPVCDASPGPLADRIKRYVNQALR